MGKERRKWSKSLRIQGTKSQRERFPGAQRENNGSFMKQGGIETQKLVRYQQVLGLYSGFVKGRLFFSLGRTLKEVCQVGWAERWALSLSKQQSFLRLWNCEEAEQIFKSWKCPITGATRGPSFWLGTRLTNNLKKGSELWRMDSSEGAPT